MTTETSTRRVLTITDFAKQHPSFTAGVLRNLIWKAETRRSSLGVIAGNGLASAIVRVGRRVYIDEARFFQWLDGQQAKEGTAHAA